MGDNMASGQNEEECFLQALAQEPPAHGLDASSDMGLRFVVMVSAKHWVGKALASPRFDTVGGLSAGLCAWRQLSEARGRVYCGQTNRHTSLGLRHTQRDLESAWVHLRAAYIDVWTGCGYRRDAVVSKLRALEDRHMANRKKKETSVATRILGQKKVDDCKAPFTPIVATQLARTKQASHDSGGSQPWSNGSGCVVGAVAADVSNNSRICHRIQYLLRRWDPKKVKARSQGRNQCLPSLP